mmetsp:Transcript_10667/g.41411  ORF Transcript_10667/g.41411 Transcript_10667/m.41411 type:complete len:241 (+) Transcript_10667:1161-1883(+)
MCRQDTFLQCNRRSLSGSQGFGFAADGLLLRSRIAVRSLCRCFALVRVVPHRGHILLLGKHGRAKHSLEGRNCSPAPFDDARRNDWVQLLVVPAQHDSGRHRGFGGAHRSVLAGEAQHRQHLLPDTFDEGVPHGSVGTESKRQGPKHTCRHSFGGQGSWLCDEVRSYLEASVVGSRPDACREQAQQLCFRGRGRFVHNDKIKRRSFSRKHQPAGGVHCSQHNLGVVELSKRWYRWNAAAP